MSSEQSKVFGEIVGLMIENIPVEKWIHTNVMQFLAPEGKSKLI